MPCGPSALPRLRVCDIGLFLPNIPLFHTKQPVKIPQKPIPLVPAIPAGQRFFAIFPPISLHSHPDPAFFLHSPHRSGILYRPSFIFPSHFCHVLSVSKHLRPKSVVHGPVHVLPSTFPVFHRLQFVPSRILWITAPFPHFATFAGFLSPSPRPIYCVTSFHTPQYAAHFSFSILFPVDKYRLLIHNCG